MALLAEALLAGSLVAGANYADMHTTQQALGRGGVEVNGLIGRNGQRLELVKVGAVAFETGVFLALRKSGHKKAAWAWVATIVVANGAMAIHNNGVANKH